VTLERIKGMPFFETWGDGSDTYLFGSGFGHDRIVETAMLTTADDVIQFEPGIAPADLILQPDPADDGDLLIKMRNTDDAITVAKQFSWRGIEMIRYGDGTIWDRDEIETRAER